MEEILKVEDLSIIYKTDLETVYAVNGISFSLKQGETMGLVGETGAGKTTTAMGIMGLLPKRTARITSGQILFENRNVCTLKEREMERIRGQKISMIFQDPMTALNPLKKIGYHMIEVLRRHQNLSKAEARKVAIDMLGKVGIPSAESRMDQYPHEFSGGMRQRAVMAIALAGDPKILFADEPTTALDVTIQAQILDVFRRIQKKMEMATVFISHDLGVVAGVADRVAVMYAGKIVEIGTAEEIFYDPRHPYTWGLLQSLPILAGEKEWLPTLPGMPPTLIHPPKGDAFAERNVYAMRIDYEKEPPMFRITDTHYAATWLLDERAPKVKVPIGGRRYGK